MSYISPFNDMQNLDENNHEFINQNTYKIIQSNVAEEDYIVNYGQGSASEACNLEPPTFGVAVMRAFTPPTTNFIGDRRSPEKFEANAEQNFVPLNSANDYHEKVEKEKENAKDSISIPNKPVHVKNDVHIHWDSLTHFYFASLTVVSLFIMFRSLQNSH